MTASVTYYPVSAYVARMKEGNLHEPYKLKELGKLRMDSLAGIVRSLLRLSEKDADMELRLLFKHDKPFYSMVKTEMSEFAIRFTRTALKHSKGWMKADGSPVTAAEAAEFDAIVARSIAEDPISIFKEQRNEEG